MYRVANIVAIEQDGQNQELICPRRTSVHRNFKCNDRIFQPLTPLFQISTIKTDQSFFAPLKSSFGVVVVEAVIFLHFLLQGINLW